MNPSPQLEIQLEAPLPEPLEIDQPAFLEYQPPVGFLIRNLEVLPKGKYRLTFGRQTASPNPRLDTSPGKAQNQSP